MVLTSDQVMLRMRMGSYLSLGDVKDENGFLPLIRSSSG